MIDQADKRLEELIKAGDRQNLPDILTHIQQFEASLILQRLIHHEKHPQSGSLSSCRRSPGIFAAAQAP